MPAPRSVSLRWSTLLLALAACRIETRPPAEVARTQATIQAAVTEHYRARSAFATDSVEYTVTRRQADVHRDLASVWVTLRERHPADSGQKVDTTKYEHLLLRRTDGGWIVLSASPMSAP